MKEVHYLVLLVLAVSLPNNIKAYEKYNYNILMKNMTYVLETEDAFRIINDSDPPQLFYATTITFSGYYEIYGILRDHNTSEIVDEDKIYFCSIEPRMKDLIFPTFRVIRQIITADERCPIVGGLLIPLVTEWSGIFSVGQTDCMCYDLEIYVGRQYEDIRQFTIYAQLNVSGDEIACDPKSP